VLMPGAATMMVALAGAVLLFAALHDIAFRTVPDWVSAVLALGGGVARVLDGQWAMGLTCGLAVSTLAALCWWRGWLGGGDVKLLGATAILVRPDLVPGYVLMVALAGGGLGLIYLLLERIVSVPPWHRQMSLLRRVMAVECRRIRRRASLPYAAAISAAAILMLAKS